MSGEGQKTITEDRNRIPGALVPGIFHLPCIQKKRVLYCYSFDCVMLRKLTVIFTEKSSLCEKINQVCRED